MKLPQESTNLLGTHRTSLFVGFCLLDTQVQHLSMVSECFRYDIFSFSVSRSHTCVHARATCVLACRCVVLRIWKHIVSRNMRRWMIEIVFMCTLYTFALYFAATYSLCLTIFFFIQCFFLFFTQCCCCCRRFFLLPFNFRAACLSSFYFNQLTCVNAYLWISPLFSEYFYFSF